jgi:hypothetical protein
VLALMGLRRLMRDAPVQFAPLVACILVHLALVATLKFWAGEWAWGPRYMVAALPLTLVGLPFAWDGAGRRGLTWAICGLGLVVQLLGIAVDHQRYYVERQLSAYFWVDETTMYTDSPLFARPFEVAAMIDGHDRAQARALVPGPLPLSMTSGIFGPPFHFISYSREWMRRYLVFSVPRPWTLWSRWVPERYRPGPTGMMTVVGSLVALASFGLLAACTVREGQGRR